MEFELSKNQISQIAQMLYLNLDNIKTYITNHKEEYNKFLNEVEQKNKIKKFIKFKPKDTIEKNFNKQKKYNIDFYTIWNKNPNGTVCQIINYKKYERKCK